QANGQAGAAQGFVFGLPSSPFGRIFLVETTTPAQQNDNNGPSQTVVLPVFLATPNFLPATLFALLGTSPGTPPGPALPSLRGYLFPANFPGSVVGQNRNLHFRSEPSGTSAAGSIGGEVFQDTNGNGQHDAAEPGLGEVRITLERRLGDRF